MLVNLPRLGQISYHFHDSRTLQYWMINLFWSIPQRFFHNAITWSELAYTFKEAEKLFIQIPCSSIVWAYILIYLFISDIYVCSTFSPIVAVIDEDVFVINLWLYLPNFLCNYCTCIYRMCNSWLYYNISHPSYIISGITHKHNESETQELIVMHPTHTACMLPADSCLIVYANNTLMTFLTLLHNDF